AAPSAPILESAQRTARATLARSPAANSACVAIAVAYSSSRHQYPLQEPSPAWARLRNSSGPGLRSSDAAAAVTHTCEAHQPSYGPGRRVNSASGGAAEAGYVATPP